MTKRTLGRWTLSAAASLLLAPAALKAGAWIEASVQAPGSLECGGAGWMNPSFPVWVQISNTGDEPCHDLHYELGGEWGGGGGDWVGTLNPGDLLGASFSVEALPTGCDVSRPLTVTWSGSCGSGTGQADVWLPCCAGGSVGASETPAAFRLAAPHPNPFNPSTTLEFSLDENSPATLEIFDLGGRRVATLFDGMAERGTHAVVFDAGERPSGLYLARLRTEHGVRTQKLLLSK